MTVSQAPRIVLISPDCLSRCMPAVPAIQASKRAVPSCRFLWITHRDAPSLLDAEDEFTECLLWKRTPRGSRLSWSLRAAVRRYQPHATVNLLLESGAQGDETASAYLPPQQLFARLRAAFAGIGIQTALAISPLSISETTRRSVERFLRLTHFTCPYLTAHVGASRHHGEIARKYGSALRRLGRKWRLPSLVLFDGPAEQRWAEAAVARSGGHAVLAPAWSWSQQAVALQRSEALLAHDPAFLQWSRLVGAPRVDLRDVGAILQPDDIVRLSEAVLSDRHGAASARGRTHIGIA